MATSFSTMLDWITGQQIRMADLLQAWACINTGTYHAEGLARQVTALLPAFSELGVTVNKIPLRPHTILNDAGRAESKALGSALSLCAPPRNGPRVLLAIHYDTVYGADHPFQFVSRPASGASNTLVGPGVCDAKGGLIVLLFALLALERSPVAHSLNWEVLLNPDEEIGSPGSGRLFDKAARRNDLALLFEPALPDGALVSSRKGSGNFTLIVHGKSAHAGRNADLGRNAIHALAPLISTMAAWQQEFPGIVINTGFIHGGGPVNIVPDRAICRLNIRIDNAGQQRVLEERLAALTQNDLPEGIRVECTGGFHGPPKPLTPAVEKLLHHFADCGKALDIPITWRPTGGTCDGNRLAAAGLPTLDSLGVRGGNIHTDQEFIELGSLAERARLVALFLMRLAAGDITLDSISPARGGVQKPLAEVRS